MASITDSSHLLDGTNLRLLDTPACLEIARTINAFENEIFGPDFSCPYESILPWITSRDLFFAAIVGPDHGPHPDRPRILSVASILLAEAKSSHALIDGRIAENSLKPLSLGAPNAAGCFYFSSLVACSPGHALRLYRSLQHDLLERLSRNPVRVVSAFSIASGSDGESHLERSGFKQKSSPRYLGRYPFYLLTKDAPTTHFWNSVRNASLAELPEQGSSHPMKAFRYE